MRTRNTDNQKKKQEIPAAAEIAAQSLEKTGGPDILALLKFDMLASRSTWRY